MKKSLIAVAVVSAFAASAASAGTDGFYAGLKAGWNHWDLSTSKDYRDSNCRALGFDNCQYITNNDKQNTFTGGVFGGYNFNQYWGLEASYNFLGQWKYKGMKMTGNAIDLTARVMLPFTDDFEIFVKAGGSVYNVNGNWAKHKNGFAPVLGAGLQYYFTDNIFARVEYTWMHMLGSTSKAIGIRPDANLVTLGLGYSFGSRAAAPVVAAPEPTVHEYNETRTLGSDVLFGFDKSNLTAEGKAAIDDLTTEIKNEDIQNRRVVVVGHTDRIGSDAYNLKLSQKRAQTVANYVEESGVGVDEVIGRGKADPVTGAECDGLSRNKLIQCLSRDRRVEINVQGQIVKTVTE